jgi:hypothetical protein
MKSYSRPQCGCELGSCGWSYDSSCESYSETLASIRDGEILHQINYFWLLKESALWNKVRVAMCLNTG